MRDFLTFGTFISPSVLILLYYIGAIMIPFLGFTFVRQFILPLLPQSSKDTVKAQTTQKQKILFFILMLLCFLCMELLWRILFEFMVGYFDMHDALMKLSK